MFSSIINTAQDATLANVLICTGVSIALGFLLACAYMLQGKGEYTKNFILSLVLLPPLVQCVILMVNGNLGAGIAVAGAFSLVRFRSAPGSTKEICAIFFAMAVGLATGMGYVVFAALFSAIVAILFVVLSLLNFGECNTLKKTLKITIPEDINYTEVFDDLFDEYTSSHNLCRSKTTNLGSMFELTYIIELKRGISEKEFIDGLRTRNGNLPISCGCLTELGATL